MQEDDATEDTAERLITLKMLKKWQNDLQTDKSNKTIGNLIQAFHAALQTVSKREDEEPAKYKVDGKHFFNWLYSYNLSFIISLVYE